MLVVLVVVIGGIWAVKCWRVGDWRVRDCVILEAGASDWSGVIAKQ